jgi:hypothetical protein
MSTVSYTGTPALTEPVKTLSDGSVLVGPSGGLQFHLLWDTSVSAAPAAFKQAAEAAAGYYSQMFSNDEVINIDVGWGAADGIPVSSGDLAESVRPGEYLTYSQVLSGLDKDTAHSSVQAQADSTLPSTDPLGAKHYYVPFAEAKTLGFISSTGTEVDGYIGTSKTASLDFAQPTASGYFDAVGAFEHEISAVMGRVVHAASASAHSPYFSIDNGATNRGNYSTVKDFADWNYSLIRGDAYGAATVGTTLAMTPNDLIETRCSDTTSPPRV